MIDNSNTGLQAGLVSIGCMEFEKLAIPPYQRPYLWNTENVGQLLFDIKANSKKDEYRIGSIILHHDDKKGNLNIVDGQQRITTIVLILKILNKDVSFNAEFQSSISQAHIRENYTYIQNWLKINITNSEREQFLGFILDKCKFIWVQTNRLYEAFLMFDSQNGHGKELLPYNLLKAYHIHAFDKDSDNVLITDDKIKYDQRWEGAVKYDVNGKPMDLLGIITQRLFQIRRWGRRLDASVFTKAHIKEFKGIQIGEHAGLSQPRYNLAKLIYDSLYGASGRMKDVDPSSLFSVDMPIINGAPFFDYIDLYATYYKGLFIERNLMGLQVFYDEYPLRCKDTGRVGDKYLRHLYQALILSVYDKFSVDGVLKYYKILYDIAFRLRLELKQVRQETVFQYPKEVFSIIAESFMIDDLQELDHFALKEIICRKISDEYMLNIAKYIKETGVSIVAGDLEENDRKLFNELLQS